MRNSKERYEEKVSELKDSIKILTKLVEKHEQQINSDNEVKEKLKLVMYQLSKVTKERDALKMKFEQDYLKELPSEIFNQKKFETVYNK
mmetsp:Transcript_7340/g.8307  ORF Transcript_7340/g.8307 Transcript_7340/m.8307 type:complete len:89 (+) Transcript_7340:45-311(+)